LRKGPFLGDELTEPAKQGVGSNGSRDLVEAAATDPICFASQPDALRIGKAFGLAVELIEKNAVFFLEVINDRLLMSVQPAGDNDQEELELSCHG